jgi:hypothetical protein
MSFEPNRGQTDRHVEFIARGAGYGLFLAPTQATLALRSTRLDMKFVGANPAPAIQGLEVLPGITNYFIGDDPSRWHTGIPTYGKVSYVGLYPGIDLTFQGNQGRLEYALRVAPGADPTAFGLAFEGPDDVSVDPDGNLVLTLGAATLVQLRPVAWQIVGRSRHSVEAAFAVLADRTVSFEVSEYDPTRALTIDPTLVYSTYLGGSANDDARAIAVDAAGNAYVAGRVDSTDFPTTGGAYDTSLDGVSDSYVTKLNPPGTDLVYSTYLGGTESLDLANRIAVDAGGNAYVIGRTLSSDFPTTAGAYDSSYNGGNGDAFVSKLDAAGSNLLYSTFLGGGGTELGNPGGIAVDAVGSAYVTGQTDSSDFPTTGGAYDTSLDGDFDAFVSKLDAAGSNLMYSGYLGGTSTDVSRGIAVDSSGNAYVAGQTVSTDFPTSASAYDTSCSSDAFVTKLDAAGAALVYSTCVGGSSSDDGRAIALGALGDAYVAGQTLSSDFPTTGGAYDTSYNDTSGSFDAFVSRLDSAGSSLIYSTYLGGSDLDAAFGVAVDAAGNAHVTGETNSSDFPTTADAVDDSYGGSTDAFVSKLDATGSALAYSTFLGGTFPDLALGIAVDAAGSAYAAGLTTSSEFPTTGGAYDTSLDGTSDAFVSKISFGPGAPSTVTLSPGDAINPVGTSHTVTATVKDASAQPVPNITIQFTVAGSVSTTGTCVTDAPGQCSFTYTGPVLAGADLIDAYADTNGNGVQDVGEPAAVPATKAWVPPTSTPGQANGGGQFMNPGGTDKIAFGFSAKDKDGQIMGECSVIDPSTNTTVTCTDATSFVETGTHATVFGNATVNEEPTTYRIDVDDLGQPGKGKDVFNITTGTGYSAGGVITSGNIHVR